MFRAVSVPYNI